jgi:glucose 1-dehydrogenase
MKAITICPGVPDSAQLTDMPEPDPADGSILVQAVAMGVCGTDAEIVSGAYGEAPEGQDRLILGHESLGRVIDAPQEAAVAAGDLVVGIVRRPDPVPCPCCAVGQWDMCRNGRYTERGIKGRHGYGAERWRVEPEFCVKLDPALDRVGVLLEPRHDPRQGLGEHRAHRATRLRRLGTRAGDRSRPRRDDGGPDGRAAWARDARGRSCRDRSEA